MRKALFILVVIWFGFMAEFVWVNVFPRWSCPNILIVEIVFVNLIMGIRYGLVAAFFAGIVKDSFAIGPMGEHMLCFVSVAFMTTLLRKHIYSSGSFSSRLIVVLSALIVNYVVLCIIRGMVGNYDISMLLNYVVLPQLLTTILMTAPIMNLLKQCVSKLSFMLL